MTPFRLLWLLIFSPIALLAGEPPVRDGLLLWWEAAAQPELRRSAGLPPIGSFQPVDFVVDSLKDATHAMQWTPEHRPTLIADDEAAYFLFDGKGSFLALNRPPESAEALTIFLLAAPKANAGYFSGLFSTTRPGQNDYTSGLNIDFGPVSTKDLSVVNVESVGASGFRDLLVPGVMNAAERPFGGFHVFTVRSRPGKGGTEFFLDGFKGGDRDRSESKIGLDRITVGARLYSNDGTQPPFAQGFFEGAIAEVLVYDRALSDEQRQKVEQALLEKMVPLEALLHGAKGHALETVKDPPTVQMLVPGFTVKELPLKINNLNNVRYRHDGRLVGLGYDGRIYLLSDTDGDGLEDRAELFWDKQTLRGPLGIALTAKDDPRGDGVFVSSKGKVSLILDKDRDGRADEEIVIATGWKESFHSIDTLGLAIDPKDGSIYFGLGCVNFADPFLIDPATGQAGYKLHDTHGTVQRLSADFSKLETVCTGVRFTCALAFNRHGDLFATDQEGATWLSNGNPMDELLHIQPGKHYGFPPRHPKHLPDVRDEPAISEYGPQHQSTVGMVFNEGINGGPSFGPAHWEGDALICGESRGKLWRTKLARTPLGYVAQNHLIASLSLLTVDACVSPTGDLVVACHSGPPDWGTGPAGEGRIFKIRYTGRALPQPVTAWAAASDEFRIAFDRPLQPEDWAQAQEHIKIEAGLYVGAGDRFEVLRPGYQVVRDQLATPRRWVEVLGLSLTEDRRTLVLRVPRQTGTVNYAITLPLPDAWKTSGGLTQYPEMDVQLTLNGLAATVTGPNLPEQSTVLPHPSLAASAILTAGSSEHEVFLKAAAMPGATLALRGSVDTSNPFVPAVQPGARLDWDMTTDPVASSSFALQSDYASQTTGDLAEAGSKKLRQLKTLSVQNVDAKANGLFLAHETLRHPVATGKIFVPWAVEKDPKAKRTDALAQTRDDVNGNWLRGRHIYFSEAGCATCHKVRGEGIAFGPDLSNLIHRDRESVLKDILHPSATINPDQTGTLLKFTDGTTASGIVLTASADRVLLALPAGVQTEIPRTDIAATEPLKTSLMPEGFGEQLTKDQLEDLLTFLLTNPLEPAPITRVEPSAPPPRRLAEIAPVLNLSSANAESSPTPLRILLCAGPKDHGLDEHDYPLWLERWSRLLPLAENVTVTTANGFPTDAQLAEADVAVFYNANPGWERRHAAQLDAYHERGGGVVYIHYAIDGGKEPDSAAERMGFCFTLGSRFRHGEFDLLFKDPHHPITRGLPGMHFTDETYWNLRGDASRAKVLATALEDNEPRPQVWTMERRNSRIFGCIPGHYTWTFDDPLYRMLVFRGLCWAARQENLDRLSELTLIGARVVP